MNMINMYYAEFARKDSKCDVHPFMFFKTKHDALRIYKSGVVECDIPMKTVFNKDRVIWYVKTMIDLEPIIIYFGCKIDAYEYYYGDDFADIPGECIIK